MASLFLRKGQLANLAKAPHQAGTLSITTDERAIYLDLEDGSRIRFGDFIRVTNVEELNSDLYRPYSTTALYYVSSVNGLYSFDGEGFVLINPDYDVQLDNLQSTIENVAKALEDDYATIEYADALKEEIESGYENAIKTALSQVDAMKFMGVAHSANDLGTVGNDEGLPVAAGWTYKVGTQFDSYKVGDLLIANKDQEGDSYDFGWAHIESGYEDNYDPALVGNADNKSVTLLSGVNADLGKIVFADNYTEATGGIKSTVSVSDAVTTITTEMLWGSF